MIQDSKSIEYKNINKNLLLHSNYQLIKISGDDAGNFLQAQLTCDVNNINEQPSLGAIFLLATFFTEDIFRPSRADLMSALSTNFFKEAFNPSFGA